MDYCSSCRRHLNSALVCPGCGAYAPDIAPVFSHGRTVPAPAATAPWPETEPSRGTDAYDDAETGVEGAMPLSEGRAARRRQRARWKKNQRRAVVATTVALVGGGLTFASMDRGTGHRAQASTSPEVLGMGVGEGPVDQSVEPPTAGTGKHRKPAATPARSAATDSTHRRSTDPGPHTTSAKTQPYTAPAPHTKPATGAQPQTATTPSAGTPSGSGTTATQSPSPTPTDDSTSGTSETSGSSGSSGSSNSSGSSGTSGTSGTDQSSTAPASTSPSGICVLGLLCLS